MRPHFASWLLICYRRIMEQSIIFTATICLLILGIIGIVDGAYFHLWKFKLYKHPETKFEHLIHTIRATLFLAMLFVLFLEDYGGKMLIFGLVLVIIDVIVLLIDLVVEGDSRKKLGGLPHHEYIVHVIANGLHFVSIALILAAKPISAWRLDSGIHLDRAFPAFTSFVAQNLIPGLALLVLLHLVLMNKSVAQLIENIKWKKRA